MISRACPPMGKMSIPPGASFPLTLRFDTRAWPLGPYRGTLRLAGQAKSAKDVLTRDFSLGVISSTALDKARPGEFLYGLDSANTDIYPVHGPGSMAFYRLMGVDILRSLYEKGMHENIDDVGKVLATLSAENLQGMLWCPPPVDHDLSQRERAMKDKTAFLEEVTRRYGGKGPGKLHFFELGNEPDMTFFYPSPMSDYAQAYDEMYDAIKRGAKDAHLAPDDTVVMNGGLAFAGMEGNQRATEFIKIVDPQRLDSIAYHGHGPGIQAERSAYERVHAIAAAVGKTGHPFIETESGYNGIDRRGFDEQARTVIEKMVYAQSQKEPFLMFFRLYMEGDSPTDKGYGLTSNLTEPKPVLLAYRSLVERLRHQAFQRTLDLSGKGGLAGLDGFLFAEKDASGGATGRKTLVLFAEEPVQQEIRLQLDADSTKVADVKLYDRYGNAVAVPEQKGSRVVVLVGVDPVYLTWQSSGDASKVESLPPMLSVAGQEPLLTGATNKVTVNVRNDGTQSVEATVTLKASCRLPTQASPPERRVEVPPGKTVPAVFDVRVAPANQPLRLPKWWKVFTDVRMDGAALEKIAAMPDDLPGAEGKSVGQFVWTDDHRLDFAQVAGGYAEKRPALAFTYLDVAKAQQLSCAANADWWMAWYVNGTKVYDTLDVGNVHGSMADHTFNLPLRKGRNLIAVLVLSGSGGWKLDFGGPKELEMAVTAGQDPDHLTVIGKREGARDEQIVVPFPLQESIPSLSSADPSDELSEWETLEPLTVLDGSSVNNLWVKEPDQSRWYKGKKDLSARLWLRQSGTTLQFYASVTDDVLVEAASPAALAQGDSLHLVVADDSGRVILDVLGGLVGGRPVLSPSLPGVIFHAVRVEAPGTASHTDYRLEIPRSLLGSQARRWNVSLLDNDANVLKQTLDWGDVGRPEKGFRLVPSGVK